MFDRNKFPGHLFNVTELDFSGDLFHFPIKDSWFRLGMWTIKPFRDERHLENVVSRQSVLIPVGTFPTVVEHLKSVGDAFHDLGQSSGYISGNNQQKQYNYGAFHQFHLPFNSITGETLVFVRFLVRETELFINPDLYLFFRLEEQEPNSGIWWDPRKGVEALRRRKLENNNLEIVEIRKDYLLKYLQARQLVLLVGHYRHLHLYEPKENKIKDFVEEDLVMETASKDAKVIIQNWGLRKETTEPFLQRRLHLWFQIQPPEIDLEDPWTEEPSFDVYSFTLPISVGLVAPARFNHFRNKERNVFMGKQCDFMDRIYFRQEVLSKYEGLSGFNIADDGSVSCYDTWGLNRSMLRIGNELLSTSIGDFAEGVTVEEWPHWKMYAVDPPSEETVKILQQEQTIASAVNQLAQEVNTINSGFAHFSSSLDVFTNKPLWAGSLDSLAGRQLKYVYPVAADDDEFLKRATLTSTFVLDGLNVKCLRMPLKKIGDHLIYNQNEPLGSRNLLQRILLVAILVEQLQADASTISPLIMQAEGLSVANDYDLQMELSLLHQRARDIMAPLAFLYDLRIHGGLAHQPNKIKAAQAATKLGLPEKTWNRTHYLLLLKSVAESIRRISSQLQRATLT